MNPANSQALSRKRHLPGLLMLALALAFVQGIGPLADTIGRHYARLHLGGDVEVLQVGEPIPYDVSARMLLHADSISRVEDTDTVATRGKVHAIVILKGIDVTYPLYGKLKLTRDKQKNTFFSDRRRNRHGAAVDRQMLAALNLKIGQTFKIGRALLEVTAIIEDEPDAPRDELAKVPRVIVNTGAFSASGIAQGPESHVIFRCRAKLPKDTNLGAWETEMLAAFPYHEWFLRDWRNPDETFDDDDVNR